MSEKKSYEIARETLRQLTHRKLAPTPVNYKATYNEIAGIPSVEHFPAQELRSIASELPAKTPGQQRQKGLLESAIDRMNWDGVRAALVAHANTSTASVPDGATAAFAALAGAASTAAPPVPIGPDFLAHMGRLIEYLQPALGTDDERFSEQGRQLVKVLKEPAFDLIEAKQLLMNYSHRLSFAAEDQAEIKRTLLRLLRMVFENIGNISMDDQWLAGQMESLRAATEPPLTLRRLDEVAVLLKDVIFKQKDAKQKAVQAQDEMRQMLATFIERLSKMSQSTGSFHEMLNGSARQIESAKSLAEIAPVLKEVVAATRNMTNETLATRDELQRMRAQVNDTQAQLTRLHLELDRVSALARHDPVTGALNRKGLEEALEREISAFRRKETPLSVSLLDVDNFKTLNDSMGHAAGDSALAHLAQVARQCLRPQDSLARYGGEEFVVLMPDTPMEQGIEAMTRLQRELTKTFFMAGNEKVLITFSAGVAQVMPSELGMDAIRRADKAMYLAKRAGKNRVVGS